MDIKLGVGLHWTGDLNLDDVKQLVQFIDHLDYNQVWVTNEKFFYDMNAMTSIVAQNTNKVQIGTFVADPYSTHPALLAMQINTLDKISNQRAVLGIGAGGTGFPAMGLKRVKPALAIKEAIQVIRRLLAGETVNFQGQVIQCTNARLNVPARADIPIVEATRGELVFKVGGEVGDGVMISTYAEPVGMNVALNEIKKGTDLSGRKLSDLNLIARVDACISENRRQAIDAVKPMIGISLWNSYPDRSFVHRVGLEVPDELEEVIKKRDYNLMKTHAHLIPDSFIDKFCWAGTAEDVAEKVAAVVDMGITNITFLPHPAPGASITDIIREFSTQVKPRVEALTKA